MWDSCVRRCDQQRLVVADFGDSCPSNRAQECAGLSHPGAHLVSFWGDWKRQEAETLRASSGASALRLAMWRAYPKDVGVASAAVVRCTLPRRCSSLLPSALAPGLRRSVIWNGFLSSSFCRSDSGSLRRRHGRQAGECRHLQQFVQTCHVRQTSNTGDTSILRGDNGQRGCHRVRPMMVAHHAPAR